MPATKVERVNSDDITIYYQYNWYAILFTGLVQIEAAQLHYGLTPNQSLFIPLGMLHPYAPKLKDGRTADYTIYPPPPEMTDEVQLEMRVRLMRNRIKLMDGTIFPDLKTLMDNNASQFTTLLAESLLP